MKSEPGKYRRQSHISAVLKASQARHSAQAILMALCISSEFDRPTATLTKDQISALTGGLHKLTIMRGLRFLEQEGSIKVILNAQGGRSNAPTYLLMVRTIDEPTEPGEEKSSVNLKEKQDGAREILRAAGYRHLTVD